MNAHISAARLESRIAGHASKEEQRSIDKHASSCDDCRRLFGALALAAPYGTAEEEAIIQRILVERPTEAVVARVLRRPVLTVAPSEARPALGGRSRLRFAVAAAAVAACLVAVVWVGWDPVPAAPTLELQLAFRATEGRPALVRMPYAPYIVDRGGNDGSLHSEAAIGDLVGKRAADARRILTGLYLWRGERGDFLLAKRGIEGLPASAERDNDQAVIHLALGQSEEALGSLQAALEKNPGLLEARFNLGLALEGNGQLAEAREAWQEYLEMAEEAGETEWILEAKEHRARVER